MPPSQLLLNLLGTALGLCNPEKRNASQIPRLVDKITIVSLNLNDQAGLNEEIRMHSLPDVQDVEGTNCRALT